MKNKLSRAVGLAISGSAFYVTKEVAKTDIIPLGFRIWMGAITTIIGGYGLAMVFGFDPTHDPHKDKTKQKNDAKNDSSRICPAKTFPQAHSSAKRKPSDLTTQYNLRSNPTDTVESANGVHNLRKKTRLA